MRKLFMLVMTGILLMSAAAYATHWESIDFTADCEGWRLDSVVVLGATFIERDISYTVQLMGADGLIVEHTGVVDVPVNVGLTHTMVITGLWDMELCGDFTVNAEFLLSGQYTDDPLRTFTVDFTCECDTPSACQLTPGFWKNHREVWPVDSLTIGGVHYDEFQLMAFLCAPVRGDATIILLHHLIAASFNVLSGADDSIGGVIEEASDMLAIYPPYSRPGNPGKSMLINLKNLLCAYNEVGCPDNECPFADKAMPMDESIEGVTGSWGGIKSLYR